MYRACSTIFKCDILTVAPILDIPIEVDTRYFRQNLRRNFWQYFLPVKVSVWVTRSAI